MTKTWYYSWAEYTHKKDKQYKIMEKKQYCRGKSRKVKRKKATQNAKYAYYTLRI